MYSILCWLIFSGSASAAEALPFELVSPVEAWPVTEVDSGWWPSVGPVRVRTVLLAEGVAEILLVGASVLNETASGVVQRLDGEPDGGHIDLKLDLLASLYLSLDVAGYSYEEAIHEESVELNVSAPLEPFAFAESGGQEVAFPISSFELFSVDQDVFPMVEVVVTADLSPTAVMDYRTLSIRSEWGEFTGEEQTLSVSGGGPIDLTATAELVASLDLLVQGHAEVCIAWVDCYGDFNFDFPLETIEHSQEVVSEPAEVDHKVVSGAAGTGKNSTSKPSGCAVVPGRTSRSGALAMVFLVMVGMGRRDC